MAWQTILSTAGSIFGAGQQKEAAAEAQEQAAWAQQMATESQRKMFEEGQAFLDPFRQAGYAGLGAYEGAPQYGFSPEDLYRLQEDQAALQRIYSAQGKRKSGQAARGQMDLFQRATADAYNRAYGRQLEAAGIGSQAAQAGAQQALGTGRGIASAYMQGAQNQIPYINLQGQMNAANIAALTNLGGNIANYWQAQPSAQPSVWDEPVSVGAAGSQNLWGEEF
jgi:hypothetical protein